MVEPSEEVERDEPTSSPVRRGTQAQHGRYYIASSTSSSSRLCDGRDCRVPLDPSGDLRCELPPQLCNASRAHGRQPARGCYLCGIKADGRTSGTLCGSIVEAEDRSGCSQQPPSSEAVHPDGWLLLSSFGLARRLTALGRSFASPLNRGGARCYVFGA